MKVHIVTPDPRGEGIIDRLARILAEQTGWTLSQKPQAGVNLNYSSLYIDYAQRFTDWKATPWAAYFSHFEVGTHYKEFWWETAAQGVRIKTITAKRYAIGLQGNIIHVPAPIDPLFTIRDREAHKQPVIGVSGFTDRSGRKGERLVAQLASDLDGKARIVASGNGWPVEIINRELKNLPAFYNSLDLYICTSLIEGIPMPPLEALACGIPVVIPEGVGMLDELPKVEGIYRYPAGDYSALHKTVKQAMHAQVNREALRAVVAGYTPQAYAQAHVQGFETALHGMNGRVKTGAVTAESDRHGGRGVYFVAFGAPARKCAQGAIGSFKMNIPDVPVALVSDTPLGPEDIYIQQDDFDIGGRAAKIKIYDLAPKDWQYIAYLDADIEIIAAERLLWTLVEDGWDMVICRNPGKFANATNMKRSDNADECEMTYRKIGTDEVLQLNGGVFAFQRNERTKAFFHAWYEEWIKWGKRDQAALLRALWQHPIKLYVLGNEWNTITRYDSADKAAWLLHYPMTARRWRGVLHYRLDDPQAWQAVREFEASHK